MSCHTQFKKTQRGQASRISCVAHLPAERRITCRVPAIHNRLHGYRTYWHIVDHHALTSTRLGLVPYVRVAIPGPPAAIRDQAPGLDVLVPQILQRLERRQGELGSAAALALLPDVVARRALAARQHRRPADGVERGVLVAVPGTAAAAPAAAGPRARALAGDAAPADGEVRREGAVEGRGHYHRDQRTQDGQAGADDGHVGLEGQPQLRLEEAHCAMVSKVSVLVLGVTAHVSARVGWGRKEELTGEVKVPFAAFYQLEVVVHPDAARGRHGCA